MLPITTHRRTLTAPSVRCLLKFRGLNSVNSNDVTLFVDRIRLISRAGVELEVGLINPDFQYPVRGNGYYEYLDNNADPRLGWTFKNGAGIATNDSAFNVPGTPDGNAVCFLQLGQAELSQTIVLPRGHYRIKFLSAQRSDNQDQDAQVTVNGVEVLHFQPAHYTGFISYTSDEFTV